VSVGAAARRGLGLAALVAGLVLASTANASYPAIQAHRGGAVVDGVPRYPENTLPAFRHAARADHAVLELDVKLTRDHVPVVIHNDTPDGTTTCNDDRPVRSYTLAQLRRCRADLLGSPGGSLPTRHVARPKVRIPTLAQVLRLARRRHARVNVEIKNLPTDNDFDPTTAFADRVIDAIVASRLPHAQVIVQSFLPQNLTRVEERLPDVEASFLTLDLNEASGPEVAAAGGIEWVSPQFPVDAAYVSRAHDRGLRVVPYTLDSRAAVRAAARAGVDEIITNDPTMARRALRPFRLANPRVPPPPSRATCRRLRAHRTVPVVENLDPRPGGPRVFAMQLKQELRHVRSYGSFRAKIECMIRTYVVPRMSRRRPNLVALGEDVGLATLAIGSRGREARRAAAAGGSALEIPSRIADAYAGPLAAYRARFPGATLGNAAAFLAATDTLARGWMQTFSDMARRYDVYIAGSADQAPFRESTDTNEVDLFRDPDLPRPRSVYVATSPRVYNEAFVWGPHDIRRGGPRPLGNVVQRNRKVPLTAVEKFLDITPGPARGPDAIANLRPYRLPGTRARIGIATSLPAFRYGPRRAKPCANVAVTYMRCLDRLGANIVLQDEANPGSWAANGGNGYWQPLEWMRSTWRAVVDPSVDFTYSVTPHLVGNLADLPFDGQTAITQRSLRGGRRCTYVGNGALRPGDGDPPSARRDAGPKREFLALVPWVVKDGPRARLRRIGAALAARSGRLANDYVETAAVADLPFPPDRRRRSCATSRPRR
jgi:glycerophosphoryl diester phosphodiesterase